MDNCFNCCFLGGDCVGQDEGPKTWIQLQLGMDFQVRVMLLLRQGRGLQSDLLTTEDPM